MNEEESRTLGELIHQSSSSSSSSNIQSLQSIIDGQLLYLYLKYQQQQPQQSNLVSSSTSSIDEYCISLAKQRAKDILLSFNERTLNSIRDPLLQLYGTLFKGVRQRIEEDLLINNKEYDSNHCDGGEHHHNELLRVYNETIDKLVSNSKVPEEIQFIDEDQRIFNIKEYNNLLEQASKHVSRSSYIFNLFNNLFTSKIPYDQNFYLKSNTIDRILTMTLEYHYHEEDDNEKNSYWTSRTISESIDSICKKLILYCRCDSFKDLCIQRKQLIYTTFLPITNKDDKSWQKSLVTIHSFKSLMVLFKENDLVDIITYELKLLIQSALANIIQNVNNIIKVIGIQITNYILSISTPAIHKLIINDDIYKALTSTIELFDLEVGNESEESQSNMIKSNIELVFNLTFKLLFSIYQLNVNDEITHPLFFDQQQQTKRQSTTTTTMIAANNIIITPFSRHQSMLLLMIKILSSDKTTTFKKVITIQYTTKLFQSLSIYSTIYLKMILPLLCDMVANPKTRSVQLKKGLLECLKMIISICWIRIPAYKSLLIDHLTMVVGSSADKQNNINDTMDDIKTISNQLINLINSI